MARVPIKFPVQSAPGERAHLGGGRLVNVICEQGTDGRVDRKRAPGLSLLTQSSSGRSHVRGMIAANTSQFLVVFDEGVEVVTYSSGTVVDLGDLPGTDNVTLARNNADPPQIVCVCDAGTFLLSASAGPVPYPDTDVGSPNSVSYNGGYFIFTYGDGSCIASKINSTDIDVLDSIKAESHTDGLMRSLRYQDDLFLFGEASCEVNRANSAPTGFPFDRIDVIERGLIAPFAVAGSEDGFTHNLIWVAPDGIVYILNGYTPTRVSSFEVEDAIDRLTTAEKQELQAFVYVATAHPIWCLKSAKWTWCYDLLTSTWHERRSFGMVNWRVESSVFIQNSWVLGDGASGKLFLPRNDVYDEAGDPMEWLVESMDPGQFPDNATVPRADFEFAPGTGRADGAGDTVTDPTVWISWSNDGGGQWNIPRPRKLGKQGETWRSVIVNGTGRASRYGRRWRLSVTDPVQVHLVGGSMDVQDVSR